MFAGKNDNTWTRKENLPILPLKAGWCVPLVASSEKQARFRRRQAMASATGLRNAMMGPEFVAEVLASQPSHRLLMIAPPLRIFNYTDQVLGLVFEIKLPGGTFEKIITRNSDARMMPAHLLGAQQPIDVQPLGLPPSPLLETSGSMEGSQFTDDAGTRDWHLPPNSIACVPIPKQICSGTTDILGFRILANPSEDNFSASMVMPITTLGTAPGARMSTSPSCSMTGQFCVTLTSSSALQQLRSRTRNLRMSTSSALRLLLPSLW